MNNNIIFNNLFALRKSIYLLLALLLFALIYLSQQQKIEFFDVKNVVYQTSSDNLGAKNSGPVIIRQSYRNIDVDSLSISFDFINNDPSYSYGNLFQTGDSPNAIRMELQPKNKLVIVLGNKGVFPVLENIKIGQHHSVLMTYKKNNQLKIFIDNREDFKVKDIRLLKESFDFSKILVGTGFQSQRTFNGLIENFNLHFTYYTYTALAIFADLLIILFVIYMSCRRNAQGSSLLTLFFKQIMKAYSSIGQLKFPTCLNSQQKIVWTSTIIAVGFFLALIFHYVKNVFFPFPPFPVPGEPGPSGISTFFHQPINLFCDFFSLFQIFETYKISEQSLYFPASNLLLGVFSFLGGNDPYKSVAFDLVIASLITLFLTWVSLHKHFKTGAILYAFIIVFMSYPFLFTLHTANLEIWVFIFLCSFFLLYKSNRFSLSAFFLASAISIKLYPLLFITLLVLDKKYQIVFETVLWTILLTILPFFIWPTSIDTYLDGLGKGMAMYNHLMIESRSGLSFGHSLLNSYRIIMNVNDPAILLSKYYFWAVVIFSGLMIFLIKMEKLVWKNSLLLSIVLCLIPPTSTDYKLLLFFIPFFLFVNQSNSSRFDTVTTFLFGLLFVNKAYIFFNNQQYETLNSVLNTLIMICMILVLFFDSMYYKKSASNIDVQEN